MSVWNYVAIIMNTVIQQNTENKDLKVYIRTKCKQNDHELSEW